jgi:maleylacetate reductase
MQSFVYEALPARVLFGSGTIAQLRAEAERLDAHRVLVLSTPGRGEAQAHEIAAWLGDLAVGVHAGAMMHTPVQVTEKALQVVEKLGADAIVAVGGGSTIGLSKAIALRTELPQIVLPTTYAGSEVTSILGGTKDGVKTTQRSLSVLPEVVIYDVELTLTLPPAVSATSGLNAIAHAVEALYARDTNPIVGLVAVEGMSALSRSLPLILKDPLNTSARSEALYGAWLCGLCLGSAGMALHHRLCHTLGAAFSLPHAETHAILLPHSAAYNAPAAPSAMARVAQALGSEAAALGLYDLAGRLGVKRALRDIGMPENGIDHAADLALASPYWNPRALERSAIRDLIARAYEGLPPG